MSTARFASRMPPLPQPLVLWTLWDLLPSINTFSAPGWSPAAFPPGTDSGMLLENAALHMIAYWGRMGHSLWDFLQAVGGAGVKVPAALQELLKAMPMPCALGSQVEAGVPQTRVYPAHLKAADVILAAAASQDRVLTEGALSCLFAAHGCMALCVYESDCVCVLAQMARRSTQPSPR